MARTARRLLLTLAALLGCLTALAEPAQAAGTVQLEGGWSCQSQNAGKFYGTYLLDSTVSTPATITEVSGLPSNLISRRPAAGSVLNTYDTAPIDVSGSVDSPQTYTLRVSLRWESRTDGGPLEQTLTQTLRLNPCQPDLRVTMKSECAKQITLTMTNGDSTDMQRVGGYAFPDITASGGYHNNYIAIQPWRGPSMVYLEGAEADWVTVKHLGEVVFEGTYQRPAWCSGGAGPDSPNPATTGASGHDTGGQPTGGQPTGGQPTSGGAGPTSPTGSASPALSAASPSALASDEAATSASPTAATVLTDLAGDESSGPLSPTAVWTALGAAVVLALGLGAWFGLRRRRAKAA
ncbi:hypothetical protein [Catellatospora tritici]|uniref:hypothetical protein n=1 Tax=Catellatospora tritici TaxID=2851566 RepID=UPI001C2D8900|nr:hypothetical protein [Catellatospora tritici]MBV1848863.1 hypothetical protein [Catellatospora tritici]